MKPILIDSQVLKKLGFFAVLFTVLVFAGGFLLGYQQASHLQEMFVDDELLSSLTNTTGDNELPAEGDIDQQQTENVTTDDKVNIDHRATAMLAEDQAKALAREDAEDRQQNISQQAPSTDSVQPSIDKEAAIQTSNDKPRKIRFSIQVGIYGSLKNARKMQDKLQAQNLDAYVSSNKNKQSKLRFNVRFGYFENKKSANLALKNFRNIQKGDGYVVNFSAKNIISSDEDNNQQAAARQSPVTSPVNVSVPGSPETGNVETQDVITKSQEKSLVN